MSRVPTSVDNENSFAVCIIFPLGAEDAKVELRVRRPPIRVATHLWLTLDT